MSELNEPPRSREALLAELRDFVLGPSPSAEKRTPLHAVSLFSGAGLSDFGYELAGFVFGLHVERDPRRAAVGAANSTKGSDWMVADVRKQIDEVVAAVRQKQLGALDLLVATPPCQGMSSSNPSRGRRKDNSHSLFREKNELALQVIPVAKALRPRVVVIENVRQLRTLPMHGEEGACSLLGHLRESLHDHYEVFDGSLEMADFGIPQSRRRAIVVAVSRDEAWLTTMRAEGKRPWPSPTHGGASPPRHKPVSIEEWLQLLGYPSIDSLRTDSLFARAGEHPLHFVPTYGPERYRLVADIPPRSGRSAYENDGCPYCGIPGIPLDAAVCPECSRELFNRPIVGRGAEARLIRGFKSSYRRMRHDLPASTITTASGHLGSDNKIHPYENRLLSLLESADLQTVPRFYSWEGALKPGVGKPLYNIIREVVGEAFPPYFTFLHGRMLHGLLR